MNEYDYDAEIEREPLDKADEYATGILDSMTSKEKIKKAQELELLESPSVLDEIEEALYSHFYEEFEGE